LGLRFLDEGEDLGFYTYAKIGARIMHQPGSLAWQIFDRKTHHLLEARYSTSDPIEADTLAELLQKLDLDDRGQALRTLEEYNRAAVGGRGFDPSRKDAVATTGRIPNKSNWALRLDTPPYVAYSATGGLFHHSYPGGTGLVSGAVFGRVAGRNAAAHARAR
jgi:tricarballylate dehydrogenase